MITIDDFEKVELRTAKVAAAERVEGSEKLLKLTIDAGDKDAEGNPALRQIVSGIAKAYAPEAMVGKTIVIVANLEPRTLMGLESRGMILAVHDDMNGIVVLTTEKEVAGGARVG